MGIGNFVIVKNVSCTTKRICKEPVFNQA